MAAESSKSATSSFRSGWTYDVFLSFRGETRFGFTDHLHSVLKQKGIIVFRDEEKLNQGRNVRPELLKAIQESEYAVIVISENYASSTWCLDELVEIVKCKAEKGVKVLPIFYKVDPSDIRKQNGSFRIAFSKHMANNVDEKRRKMWRDALEEVCNISGWDVRDRHESKAVEDICTKIFDGLSHQMFKIDDNLVGIESHMEELMTLLDIKSDDVQFIGICGMGGIGKTTLAKVIYGRVFSQFGSGCFISNVREESLKSRSLLPLQKELVSHILGEKELNIHNTFQGQSLIANRAKNKKVFIVLDDVDKDVQLEELVGNHNWFGEGSRILVTSRDRNLLKRHMDHIYEVKGLTDHHALQLFNMQAFKQCYSEGIYDQYSKDILKYAGGLPLAVKVFGSFLFDCKLDAWKSALDRLKVDPGSNIVNILKISFEGLDNSQQSLFLDIACFFKGKPVNSCTYKLAALGHFPEIDIPILESKSLIKISRDNKIEMHDLLQQMGHQIVHDLQKDPSKRSRLWHYEDIIHILKNNIGIDVIESIVLKVPFQGCKQLNLESLSKMNNLKMFEINCSEHYDDIEDLEKEWQMVPSNFFQSNKLCVIEWWRYPLQCLPTNFQFYNLITLSLPWSKIKLLWDGKKSFKKLKYINLRNSSSLMKTPDFSEVPNLEELELLHCVSLYEIHPSIRLLRQLKFLNLKGCLSLKRLPNEMDLPSLQSLDLFKCSTLEAFPNIRAPSLQSLDFSQCLRLETLSNITTPSLQNLSLYQCSRLEIFPNIIAPSLQSLNLSGCSRLETFPDIIGLSLRSLNLSNCSKLKTFPNITAPSLMTLNLSECSRLTTFPNITAPFLHSLDLSDCSKLQAFPNIMVPSLQSLDLSRCSRLEAFANITAPSLHTLDLSECSRLKAFPNITTPSLLSLDLSECLTLKVFPNIRAPSLQSLSLSGCLMLEAFLNVTAPSLQCLSLSGCLGLKAISNITALSLQSLDLSGCLRLEVFLNITAPSLQSLHLFNCSRLESFPNIIAPSLQILSLFRCLRLEAFPNITIPYLQSLDLSGCSQLEVFSNITAPSLQNLDLSGCSRLEAFPNIVAPSLQSLNVSGCSRLKAFPNIIAPSLQSLSLSGCLRLETFPNIMSPSLQSLCLSGCSRLEAFPNITAPSLQNLSLSGCSRLEAFPNIMAPSLQSLSLSGCSRLKVLPDIIAPSLQSLYLSDCLRFEAFPNITTATLQSLSLFGCSRLETFSSITTPSLQSHSLFGCLRLEAFENITAPSLQSLDLSGCSRLEAFPNVKTQSLQSLHLFECSRLETFPNIMTPFFQSLSFSRCSRLEIFPNITRRCSHAMAWGPALGSEVPRWFNHKSIGSFGSIQSGVNVDLNDDLSEWEWNPECNRNWEGYALFMVYEIHEFDRYQRSGRHKLEKHGNSNSRPFDGNDPNSPTFHCELQVSKEGPRFPLIFSAPKGPRVGLNGVWIFIKAAIFQELRKWSDRCSNALASIVTRDSNVEVKECGARLVHTSDLTELFEVLRCICPHNLGWKRSLQELCDLMFPYYNNMKW